MRTQHQIASELHSNLGHGDEEPCQWSDPTSCPVFEDIVAALREQSLLTRAAIVGELEDWATRWPMNKSVVLGCAKRIQQLGPGGGE